MLWAAVDINTWVVAGSAIVGGVITKGADALIRLIRAHQAARRTNHEIAKEERADALAEWRDWSRHLEEQFERLQAVIQQQQAALTMTWRAEARCRESLAEHRTALRYLYEHVQGLHRACKDVAGLRLDPLPEMPVPLKDDIDLDHAGHDVEYYIRQAAQSAALIREASQARKPPEEGGPTAWRSS